MFDERRLTHIATTLSQRETSRRGFLANGAKLGGGAVALALAGSPVVAFARGTKGVPGHTGLLAATTWMSSTTR